MRQLHAASDPRHDHEPMAAPTRQHSDTTPVASREYLLVAGSPSRKQPYRRPVDRASWAVAKRGTLELWDQFDEQLAREDLREARKRSAVTS